VVLRSELSGVEKGDHVYGVFSEISSLITSTNTQLKSRLEYQEYSVIANLDGAQIIENTHDLPWSLFVGVTGMPGSSFRIEGYVALLISYIYR
jgi:hypothetical protein